MVENRTGACGLIAAQDLTKSDPDGYTLMMGSQTTCAVAPALYHKVTIDPAKDFAGIALTGASPLVLVVNPNFAAHSVADVIAMAKANPGKINFGTGGVGTTPHMTAELFQYIAGIKMVHVAYRGEAPAINDLLAGQIPLMFANLSAVIGNVKAGTLRALAVTSAQRSPSAPDIPTVAETALPGFDAETWFGIVAPPGTPQEIRAKLNAAALKALAATIPRSATTISAWSRAAVARKNSTPISRRKSPNGRVSSRKPMFRRWTECGARSGRRHSFLAGIPVRQLGGSPPASASSGASTLERNSRANTNV